MATITPDEPVEMKPTIMMRQAMAAANDVTNVFDKDLANVGRVDVHTELNHIRKLVDELHEAIDDLIIIVQ
jgi:hypothetical protein